MAKYTFDCDMGHEPKHFEVEADTDDDAVEGLLKEVEPHADEYHPDMAGKPQELKDMIREKMHKEM